MMKFIVLMAVAVLTICTATLVHADTINVSEDWYIGMYNFTLNGSIVMPVTAPIHFAGFTRLLTNQRSSTTLIEPKLQNQISSNPEIYRTMVFDFHAGTATTSDDAWFEPYATIGSVWTATLSFDWYIHCDSPRVVLTVDTPDILNGGTIVWWSAPTGNTYRRGSTSFDIFTPQGDPPRFHITFASVPEPTTLAAFLIPVSLSGICFAFRRRRV